MSLNFFFDFENTGEKSQKTIYTEEKTFCERQPFSWTTKYYRLEIEMVIETSRYHYKNRGFLVGYVAYDREEGKCVCYY